MYLNGTWQWPMLTGDPSKNSRGLSAGVVLRARLASQLHHPQLLFNRVVVVIYHYLIYIYIYYYIIIGDALLLVEEDFIFYILIFPLDAVVCCCYYFSYLHCSYITFFLFPTMIPSFLDTDFCFCVG